jgi:nicotinamidase-related amidase
MDYQVRIVEMHAAGGNAALERASLLLARARQACMLVAYIQVGFRPGYPEISDSNTRFGAIKSTGRFLIPGDPDARVHPAVAPESSDVIVVKKRVSAFAGSDLEMILRSRDVHTLILFGISTSGVVLSTVRQASDMDYRLVVVEDCCLDRDEEVHRVLTQKVFPASATVVASSDILSALGAPA